MSNSSGLAQHRLQRNGLLSIWGFIGAIFLLIWCFTQALQPLMMSFSVLFPALLLDTLLRYAGKEERSPLDWLVILPFKAIGLALEFLYAPLLELLCKIPLGLPLFVGVNVYLGTLQLQGLENVFRLLGILFGLNWILILWVSFLGWLSSLAKGSED
ncbi:MAG: hypothetical protein VX346_21885 [Planctomycetota bacterium]|nr:hypothetical protein [Planctomycetota bacterium]